MKNYKLVLFNDGKITVEAEGTEAEILKFWEANKYDYIFWLNESDWKDGNGINRGAENFDRAMTAAPQSVEELQQIFDNELNYSYWKMDVVEEDADNYKEGVTLYYMDSDSSYAGVKALRNGGLSCCQNGQKCALKFVQY